MAEKGKPGHTGPRVADNSLTVGQQLTYALACEDTGMVYTGAAHDDISLLPLKRPGWSRIANTIGVGDTGNPPANRAIMGNRIDASGGLPDYLWFHGIMVFGTPGATTADCTLLRLTNGGNPVAIATATGVTGTGGAQIQFKDSAGAVLFTTRNNAFPVAGLSPIEVAVRLSYLTATPIVSNQVSFYSALTPYSPTLQCRPNVFGSVPPDNVAVVSGSLHNDGTYDISAAPSGGSLELQPGSGIVTEATGATVTIELQPSSTSLISNQISFQQATDITAPIVSCDTGIFAPFPPDNVAVVSGSAHNDGTYDVKGAPTDYALLLQQGTELTSELAGATVTIELKPSLSLYIDGGLEGIYAGALSDHVDGAEVSSPCNHVSVSWTELAYTDCRLINGGVCTLGPGAHADTFEWTVASFSISAVINDNGMAITGETGKIAEWLVPASVPSGNYIAGSIVTEARVSSSMQGTSPQKFRFTAAVKTLDVTDRKVGETIKARTSPGNFQHFWSGAVTFADIKAGRTATGIESVAT